MESGLTSNPNIRYIWYTCLIYCVYNIAVVSFGQMVSADVGSIYMYSLSSLIALWAVTDRSIRNYPSVYDYGYFMFSAGFLLLPWYLFKSRKWKGLLLYSGFMALYYLPYLCGLAVYHLKRIF